MNKAAYTKVQLLIKSLIEVWVSNFDTAHISYKGYKPKKEVYLAHVYDCKDAVHLASKKFNIPVKGQNFNNVFEKYWSEVLIDYLG